MTENDPLKAKKLSPPPKRKDPRSEVASPARVAVGQDPEEAVAGMVIDRRYRLDRKLGEGGMGVVWQATQEVVERPVAIKLLHSSLITSPEVQARFEVEARAIGRLRHSNCVTLFDFGRSEALNSCFMVLEFVQGSALSDLMDGREFNIDDILQIGAQTADALDHAHQQGIIHRDVKPENIMLSMTPEGELPFLVKVLDFGIARLVDNAEDVDDDAEEGQRKGRITRTGQVFGTPVYMAPEQATGKYSFGPQCDIYSLGIILYELIEGHPPFDDEQPVAILLKHVTDPLPPMTRPNVPEALKQLIYEMLEKTPATRIGTAREVKERLLEIERVLHPERLIRSSSSFVGVTAPIPDHFFDDEGFPTPSKIPQTLPDRVKHFVVKQSRGINPQNRTKFVAFLLITFFSVVTVGVVIWGVAFNETAPPEISNTPKPPSIQSADSSTSRDRTGAIVNTRNNDTLGNEDDGVAKAVEKAAFVGPPLLPPEPKKEVKKKPTRRRHTPPPPKRRPQPKPTPPPKPKGTQIPVFNID